MPGCVLFREALRVWTVHSELVISRPDGWPLEIVRVLSGHRDIPALFASRSTAEPRPAHTSTARLGTGPVTVGCRGRGGAPAGTGHGQPGTVSAYCSYAAPTRALRAVSPCAPE